MTANCAPGWHCFDVKFEKHDYVERMRFDENGKVVELGLSHGAANTLRLPTSERRRARALPASRTARRSLRSRNAGRALRRAAIREVREPAAHGRIQVSRRIQLFVVRFLPNERARGVVAFSSGNHAQGVALAARLLGIPATIVMPLDAPEVKLAATREYGAEIVHVRARRIASRRDRARHRRRTRRDARTAIRRPAYRCRRRDGRARTAGRCRRRSMRSSCRSAAGD